MRQGKWIACAAVLSLLGLGWWMAASRPPKGEGAPAAEPCAAGDAAREIKEPRARPRPSTRDDDSRTAAAGGERRVGRMTPDALEDLSPRDRACVEAIQAALDDNDYARLMPSINTAAKSASPDVRAQAVEALRWFGKAALSELTLFMADADDDVRTSACDAWTSALFEVEDPALKGKLVESAMEILTDADQLESMIMEINDLPEAQQVDILTRLIEGSNKAAADAAREHYEFVTGEPYESRDAAQKWLLENSTDSVDEFEAQP